MNKAQKPEYIKIGKFQSRLPKDQMEMFFYVSCFVMLLASSAASVFALDMDTFQPGDVSSFSVYTDNHTMYLEFNESTYGSDFSISNAVWDLTTGIGSSNAFFNDSFIGSGTADGYNGWTETASAGHTFDLTADGLKSSGGGDGYAELVHDTDNPTEIIFGYRATGEMSCSSGVTQSWFRLNEDSTMNTIIDIGTYCINGGSCNVFRIQDVTTGTAFNYLLNYTIHIENIRYSPNYDFDLTIYSQNGTKPLEIAYESTGTSFYTSTDAGHVSFRRGTNYCSVPDFYFTNFNTYNSSNSAVRFNVSLDSTESYSNFLLQDDSFLGLDISSALETSLNACTGPTCQIPINLSSSPLLTAITGNLTLSNLIINITTSPTTPTTLAPLSNATYFNAPTLTCADSSDPDGDTINYLFYSTGGGNWCDCADTESEWTGNGNWDNNCVSYASKCEMSTPTTGTYARERDYFIATNFLNFSYVSPGHGGFGSSYIHVSVDGTNILEITDNTCQAGCTTELDVSAWNDAQAHTIEVEMARPGGGDPGMSLDWWWTGMNETSEESLLQNSTSTTFDWSDISFGNTFNWYCNACDNTGACSNNTSPRTLNAMLFEVCTSGNIALNLTSWDEETDTALNSTIDSSLTLSSDYDSILFSNSDSDKHEHNYCLNPAGIDIDATGFFQYLPDNASYSFPRQYYLESATLNGNTTENIKLYSLTDALSTAVTFIASRAGSAVPNILIHLQRFDAGTGVFSLVATGKTSSAGTDVIYLRLTDAFYRVIAYESPYSTDELVYDSGTIHITSSPYTMILGGGTTGIVNDWYDTWQTFNNIGYSLTFNQSGTNAFLLVADDSSGITSSMCLKVDKWDAQGGKQNVCYDCATTSSVSISCIVPDTTSYYTAQFITNAGNDLFQMAQGMVADLSTGIKDLVGNKDGSFYTFLLTGTSAFMALYSPMAAVILLMLGLGISWAMGILTMDASMFILVIAFGLIIIAAMYKRRTA